MDFYTKLPSVPLIGDKHDFVIQQCAGKRVLHLGCVDAGVLEEKWQAGILLHQRLASVATELWGFDIDSEGIQFLQSKGVPNLVAGDGSKVEDLAPLRDVVFDVIVAGEVVEHLLNPGLFLDAVKTLMTPSVTDLIVTVPNAYGIDSWVGLLGGKEFVHPDHNYWFSYRTITNLIQKRDYQIKSVLVYSYQLVPFFFRPKQSNLLHYVLSLGKRLVTRILYLISPFFGDGIIVVASRKP